MANSSPLIGYLSLAKALHIGAKLHAKGICPHCGGTLRVITSEQSLSNAQLGS